MTGISLSFRNVHSVPAAMARLEGRLPGNVQDGLRAAGETLAKVVRTNASQRPGPVIQTGQLVSSVRVNALPSTGGSFRLHVSVDARSESGAPYPAFLERGTSRMPPYPFLGPAMAEGRTIVRDLLARSLRDGMR